MAHISTFPEAERDDLCLTFGDFGPGKLPLKEAAIQTESSFERLRASMAELGSGLLLAVYSERPGRCPPEEREAERERWRKRSCTFRRSGDPNSNFFTATAGGDGVIWIHNEGTRSLRVQTPDERIYRICTGYTEALIPSNTRAQIGPTQVLLDLGGGPLDFKVSAVYVKYGNAPWVRGGIDFQAGVHADSYVCRVFCGDDCLGVLESYSGYCMESAQLGLLDIEGCGPCRWFVRNIGEEAIALIWPDGRSVEAPADGQVYRLEALAGNGEGAEA